MARLILKPSFKIDFYRTDTLLSLSDYKYKIYSKELLFIIEVKPEESEDIKNEVDKHLKDYDLNVNIEIEEEKEYEIKVWYRYRVCGETEKEFDDHKIIAYNEQEAVNKAFQLYPTNSRIPFALYNGDKKIEPTVLRWQD